MFFISKIYIIKSKKKTFFFLYPSFLHENFQVMWNNATTYQFILQIKSDWKVFTFFVILFYPRSVCFPIFKRPEGFSLVYKFISVLTDFRLLNFNSLYRFFGPVFFLLVCCWYIKINSIYFFFCIQEFKRETKTLCK